jgi:hypothetical protein
MGKSFVTTGVLLLLVGVAAVAFYLSEDLRLLAGEDAARELRSTSIILAAVLIPLGTMFLYTGLPSRPKKLKEGARRGKATVMKIEPTGVTLHARPMYKLDLQVELEGHPPYLTSVTTAPMMAIEPGQRLAIAADPMRPQEVTVEWQRS